ncbi:MAG TPA: formylglycine-generating enzyme family protein [Gammaproteobacteria bacterium]|nr:formylglycine-generating enzyme family protein [Gammaproteobacteria bacterium]
MSQLKSDVGLRINNLYSLSLPFQAITNVTTMNNKNSSSSHSSESGDTFQDTLEDGTLGPKMLRISPGKFMMGSPETEEGGHRDERPQHEVTIEKPFALGVFPVTFTEYDHFATATGRELPADQGWGRALRPVINITCEDAEAYCSWLNTQTSRTYRLPTEAEWEYAARGGTTSKYWWGDHLGESLANCDGCGSDWDETETSPVGSFQPNPFGLYDIHGNVWEWCQDWWHNNYEGAPTDGSAWLEDGEKVRVVRGGSWINNPLSVRAAVRSEFHPRLHITVIGMRICSS